MAGVPEVTVVIPTRDRATRLAAALDALRGQTLAPERFETVVVDDGSSDGTAGVIERATDGGHAVRALRLAGDGPAAARNAGWRAASSPLIAFTDDDCEPTATWLESIARAAAANPGAVIQGPTTPIPREAELLNR